MSTYKYGDKRDYKPIRLYHDGEYVGTTTWSRTLKEARDRYATQELQSIEDVTAEFANV